MEPVADLFLVAASAQRERREGVESEGAHVLAIKGISRVHVQRDSPDEGLRVFLRSRRVPIFFEDL
jgi:hypothetical protein